MKTNKITVNPQIEKSWYNVLKQEFSKEYFANIKLFLLKEKKNYTVYPPGKKIFNAFNLTPFDKVKVVILGQDPYHGRGQAHGLCFSVPDNIKMPPSLINIFKELKSDLDIDMPKSGNLSKWAKQGVLLLNAILTVRAGQAGSHKDCGWQIFTDAVIKLISEKKENIVFILWGKFAQTKEKLIDNTKHLILKAAHPSPYSANNGFFGCKHFSKTNSFLRKNNLPTIDWKLE